MKQMPKIGWRHFVCCGCAHTWRWPCRDFTSDSGESCPKCDVWNYPQDGTPDGTIPHDELGNLTVPHNWEGAPTGVESENCAACQGSGRVPVTLAGVTAPFECPDCGGTGKRRNDPAQLREGKE